MWTVPPPWALSFIIIPILVAVLILRKTNFLVALVVGDLLGIILLLILGYSDVASIFAADGLLASGTLSLMDVLVFMALIFVVLALTEEVGVLDSFQTFMVRHAKTPRMAETVSGVFTCIFCAIIGSGMSTIALYQPHRPQHHEALPYCPNPRRQLYRGLCQRHLLDGSPRRQHLDRTGGCNGNRCCGR